MGEYILDIAPAEASQYEANAVAAAEEETGKSGTSGGDRDITSFDHDNWKEFLAAKQKDATK